MVEVREAPVPVRGRFWFESESRLTFLEHLRTGWLTGLEEAEYDTRKITEPIGYLLSNGQIVIVRARK